MNTVLSLELPEKINDLVSAENAAAYGTGVQSEATRQRLASLTVDDLFPSGYADDNMAKCCLSAVWIFHNFLYESHTISQDIPTREGSFWHAIMHRWEGDFSNSKYWYRRVGGHPVYETISAQWDPFEFVDRCQQNLRDSGREELHELALAEWVALFEYCYLNATKA